jgi:cytochrome b561
VWGLFKLPLLTPITAIGRTPDGIPTQRALRARIETFHWLGAWAMLALLVLHIAGALKHQWIDRQRELARMGIGG